MPAASLAGSNNTRRGRRAGVKFEVGKAYRTRQGGKGVVLCTDAPGLWPLKGYVMAEGGEESNPFEWRTGGVEFSVEDERPNDLVSIWEEPVSGEAWMITSQGTNFFYWTEEEAREEAGGKDRLFKIRYEEIRE
jgi:hypothetical protein